MHALELPVGTIERSYTRLGDALSWTAVPSTDHDQLDLKRMNREKRPAPDIGPKRRWEKERMTI